MWCVNFSCLYVDLSKARVEVACLKSRESRPHRAWAKVTPTLRSVHLQIFWWNTPNSNSLQSYCKPKWPFLGGRASRCTITIFCIIQCLIDWLFVLWFSKICSFSHSLLIFFIKSYYFSLDFWVVSGPRLGKCCNCWVIKRRRLTKIKAVEFLFSWLGDIFGTMRKEINWGKCHTN